MQESKALHYVLGLSLALIALFVVVALVMINTRASDTTVTINNVSPVVLESAVDAGAAITLNSGALKNVVATATVQDLNGNADIDTVTMTLYRSGAVNGVTCSIDDNDCYRIAACALTNNADPTQKIATCTFSLEHYADSTSASGRYNLENWKLYVKVTDLDLTIGELNTTTTEVNDLLSLSFPATINFGVVGLSTQGYTNSTITNVGNQRSGVNISTADPDGMNCTVRGVIPINKQEFADATFVMATAGTVLTATPTDTLLTIDWQATGTDTSDILYFGVDVPPSGVEGVCTQVDTLTAFAK